ncbi:MAG: alginate export family protein [Planctomycetes bacterium]|nr:alginate export family protein [Planctomycetota bacterium]
MFKAFCLTASVLLMVFLFGQLIWAQDDIEKDYVEQEIREELEETIRIEKTDRGFLYDYGGWLRYSTFIFEDPDKQRTLRTWDGRFWAKCLINKYHEFYFRFKTLLFDYNRHDSYGGDDHDFITPRLDQGFYMVDLVEALYGDDTAEMVNPKIKASVGRQFSLLGTGLVYSRVDDGLKLNLSFPGIQSTVIVAQTIKTSNDIDRSRPNPDRSRRSFLGLQVDYKRLGKHKPYLICLIQTDNNKETPDDAAQEYDYNSKYYGIGMKGVLFPRLQYTAEYIKETGKSYASLSSTDKETIKASAYTFELKYLPKTVLDPVFTVKYLFGSGDKDRGSVTNTIGGNQVNTNDTGFLSFGYSLTGFVLQPKISNLSMYSLMISVKPIKDKALCQDSELGVAYYMFSKDKKEGVISDLSASVAKEDIGKEIDLYFNWKMLSDLTFSLRGGRFTPGNAYPATADEETSFLSFTLSYSF